MFWDLNEKQLAEFYKKEIIEAKNNLSNWEFINLSDFLEIHKNINFELFQQECEKLGYHAKKGCDIKNKSKHFNNEWNKNKSIFLFEIDENNL